MKSLMGLSRSGGVQKAVWTWIFDLDNTLHNAGVHVFPQINRAMTRYLQVHLNVDEATANALRQKYWRRYGATLEGLIRHHRIDPEHFLRETHQFPDLSKVLVSEPQLHATLQCLPGRKFVFSNAPVHYAEAVIRALGIRDLFSAVYAIENTGYRPKPDSYGFLKLCRSYRLKPQRCIMVEDNLDNLKTAKRLGMKAFWVKGAARGQTPGYVDRTIFRLAHLAGPLGP